MSNESEERTRLGRAGYIDLVNEAFRRPRKDIRIALHWHRHCRSPEYTVIPQLLELLIGKVPEVEVGEARNEEFAIEADVTAVFQVLGAFKYQLHGTYFDDGRHVSIIFCYGGDRWGTIEERMVGYLLCNLLYNHQNCLDPQCWSEISD